MKVNSHNNVFTKKLRQLIAILISGLFIFASVNAGAGATVSIADTLGAATPATHFSVFGATGFIFFSAHHVGPVFTLTKPTTLTEIGAFVNTCAVTSVPICPAAPPLTIQIRPAPTDVSDASTVLASFVLSSDNDPLLVSFESVSVNLPLKPGTYFATVSPQNVDPNNNDVGLLLGGATSPFNYTAGLIDVAVFFPFDGASGVHADTPAAVRILGETNVLIDGCNSGVEDVVLPDGSTISEGVAECADGATNHGQFVSCIARLTNTLKKNGTITGQQKNALQSCAAQAEIP